MKLIIILSMLMLLFSCGQSEKELVDETIHKAKILLSIGSKDACQEAAGILEAVGRQTKNFDYLRNLASAYACVAGYSEPVLFGTDIGTISDPDGLLGTLSQFSTSSLMTSATDSNYTNLLKAIEILLFAGGGIDSSTTESDLAARQDFFTGDTLNDLHLQAFFMVTAALGMYVYHYGDADGGGKGDRTAPPAGDADGNNCFINYTNYTYDNGLLNGTTTQNSVDGFPAANECDGLAAGHSDLTPVADNIDRLCEGVFLFNQFKHLLPLVTAAVTSTDLDDFNGVEAAIGIAEGLFTTVWSSNALNDVNTVLSRGVCETEAAEANGVRNLETYFLFYFDTLFE